MANTIVPFDERSLTPAEVTAVDHRRRRGQVLTVIGVQMLIISIGVLLWSGQDATYSPGWAKPEVYWDLLLFLGAMTFLGRGIALRRGVNEFFSY